MLHGHASGVANVDLFAACTTFVTILTVYIVLPSYYLYTHTHTHTHTSRDLTIGDRNYTPL